MDAVVDKLIQTAKAIATPRLKDLIKSIRSCKTAAEERAVIAKESASIRTAFKEENMDTRHINVAKLLYIHMLGYPAHFGQMECLKLVASPKFSDKRLGYLGIMLLLDENQEVLTLVTNCLKNDMANPNMFIMGLALCTLGNISSPEMSRDLCSEVEKLMSSSNAYARKKANLCALRIIRKVPDLMENFFPKARNFVNERNHGVLLTGITLLTEMCAINKEVIPEVRKLVPALVGHLSNLSKPGFSPEHDVSGVTDPFLQVKILRLLRILGRNDVEASELMNDALATVANNTEASKNVGNAILYETVLTIMDIESEKSLRVLAINILGRFLSNRDNNIRYVALTTLTKTSSRPETADSSALQRHRSTILECLRDPDVSIRRRALDLSFYLIDSANIRLLTRELLSFLEVAEGEVKASVASRICDYAGRFRPNKRWEIDTVCRVLRVAGAFVDQLVINHFVKLVSTSPVELQQYTVRKLYNIVKSEGDAALMQEGLVQAMVWCCGEYGDTLTTGTSRILGADDEAGDDANADPHLSDYQTAPSESEVYETFASILKGPYATDDVQEYALTALAKLSTRFQQTAVISQIRTLIARYKVNIDVEIQQRAVEYTSLFGLDREISVAILEGVPVLESALREEDLKGKGTIAAMTSPTMGFGAPAVDLSAPAPKMNVGGGSNIIDLLGDASVSVAAPAVAAPTTQVDLLGELFGGPPASGPAVVASPSAAAPSMAIDPLADLFASASLTAAAPAQPQAKVYPAYDKNGLLITLTPVREADGTVRVTADFSSRGPQIQNLQFLVAVPKLLKLQVFPPSSSVVMPGLNANQFMKIENPTKAPIRLRLKVAYTSNGQPTDEVVDFSSFDKELYA